MDPALVVAVSAVVAAVFGAISGYWSQRMLASRQARIDYELNARTRLYEAIGPLRFQLLMASRDVLRRTAGHSRAQSWNLDPAQYYGHNTLFRLLRPLAVCILIERQMNAADFSVDPGGLNLLRFEVGAYRILTNADPVRYHQHLDWAQQTQHVFRDNLRRAAAALVVSDDAGAARVMDYSEFLERHPDPLAVPALQPLARIIKEAGSNLANNAVFWVRLVGYAFLCQRFIEENGAGLGFAKRPMDVRSLVGMASGDPEVQAHVDQQERIFVTILAEGL